MFFLLSVGMVLSKKMVALELEAVFGLEFGGRDV
jgi:hypothetical protein